MLMGCLIVTLGTAWFARTNQDTTTVGAPYGTINPNHAPWHELALLPRIGESKARAIAAHRRTTNGDEPAAAFKVADDLQRVSGIGPKTVQRLTPELRFKD
jgi:DNA uptake protein ComE-like DNA-binding protein